MMCKNRTIFGRIDLNPSSTAYTKLAHGTVNIGKMEFSSNDQSVLIVKKGPYELFLHGDFYLTNDCDDICFSRSIYQYPELLRVSLTGTLFPVRQSFGLYEFNLNLL
jgi:hypothetical protein